MSPTELPSIIVGSVIGGGLIGGVASMLGALSARKKAPLERDALIADTATHVVELLRAELDLANAKLESCDTQIIEMRQSLTDAEERAGSAKASADRLEARVARRDQTIRTLRTRVDELERRLNDGSET
jgi:chromosome segregation ATPase